MERKKNKKGKAKEKRINHELDIELKKGQKPWGHVACKFKMQHTQTIWTKYIGAKKDKGLKATGTDKRRNSFDQIWKCIWMKYIGAVTCTVIYWNIMKAGAYCSISIISGQKM